MKYNRIIKNSIFILFFSFSFYSGKTFAQNANNFGFFGYMRSGFGIDGKGGPQDFFKAPNSEGKYRLGNETEAYIEALFRYSYEDENKAHFETNLRLAFVTPTSKSNSFVTTTSVREAYVAISGIISKKKEMKFWAGQRFYDRFENHMIDFWYRDMSGFGGGFEDLKLGKSIKIAAAFLGGSIDELQSDGNVYPKNSFVFNKITGDLRMYDISLLGGKLAFTFDYSIFHGDSLITDNGNLYVDSSNGWSVGFFHFYKFKDGTNTFHVYYGNGAADNYKAIIQQPVGMILSPGGFVRTDDFSRFRILDDIHINICSRFSLLGLIEYQILNNGMEQNYKMNWFSIGIRPAYHFNQYFSLLGEVGLDYTSQNGINSGLVSKFTIAPTISPLNKILSRPALRAFFTYAKWSDEFIGLVAPTSFPDQNNGISFGIQMETWW